jgi:hypothetical protein
MPAVAESSLLGRLSPGGIKVVTNNIGCKTYQTGDVDHTLIYDIRCCYF